MTFAVVSAAWLVLALAGGIVLGLFIRANGGHAHPADESGPPLYVADILAHRPVAAADLRVGDVPRS